MANDLEPNPMTLILKFDIEIDIPSDQKLSSYLNTHRDSHITRWRDKKADRHTDRQIQLKTFPTSDVY